MALRHDKTNPLTKGLVFDVPFLEKGGIAPRDLVGRAKGAFSGSPTWVKDRFGSALSFDGNTTIVDFTALSSQKDLIRLTVEALVMARGAGAGASDIGILHKGDTSTTTKRFRFGFDNSATLLEFQSSWDADAVTGDWGSPSGSIVQNLWYHVVGTYDFSVATNTPVLYINGKSQSITTFANPSAGTVPTADGNEIGIGNRVFDLNREFNGYISYVRLWNRILNRNEVSDLYQNPWQIYYKPTLSLGKAPTAAGPVSLKTVLGLAKASVKTVNGLAIASVKTWDGLA